MNNKIMWHFEGRKENKNVYIGSRLRKGNRRKKLKEQQDQQRTKMQGCLTKINKELRV
jgi:hypothetical protein